MTKVGKARVSAANIVSQYSGVVRGITALRLTILSLCTVAAVLAYEVARPALVNFSWSFTLSDYTFRIDENVLMEAALWLLLYVGYCARYQSISRYVSIGQKKRRKVLPCLLALLPVILFFVPLRLVVVNVLGRNNPFTQIAQLAQWFKKPLTAVAFCLAALCAVILIALLFMAMKVFTARAIVNRQILGKAKLGRALKQGFQHCLSPLFTGLKFWFWLLASAILICQFAYLTFMQYPIDKVYVALGALILAGYWLCGFGTGFWGQYHVTFICLLRRLTDHEYEDMAA